MNRRSIFAGLLGVVAVPVTLAEEPKESVCMLGSPHCEECWRVMVISDVRPEERPARMYCCNPHCDRFEIRYYAPLVALERVT